jgi:hypothetical protein
MLLLHYQMSVGWAGFWGCSCFKIPCFWPFVAWHHGYYGQAVTRPTEPFLGHEMLTGVAV